MDGRRMADGPAEADDETAYGAARIADWLTLAAAWRRAMVQVQIAGSSRHLLCHILSGLWFAQVPANCLLRPEDMLEETAVDAMVRRGWLAPCPDTLHWRRSWSRRTPAVAVARELAAVAVAVLGAMPDQLAVSVVPCETAACSAHSALGDCGGLLSSTAAPVRVGRRAAPPRPPR